MKRTPTVMLAGLIAGGILLSAGCNKDRYRAPGSAGLDPMPLEIYPKVAVEPPLDRHLVVEPDLIVIDDIGGILSVSVPVRITSRRYGESNIQYRFKFYDDRGRELPVQPGWRRHRLPFRTQEQLVGNATDSNATDWRLEIRVGR